MKLFKLLTFCAFVSVLASCDDDKREETLLAEKDIPVQIMEYKNEHFSEYAIKRAIRDEEGKTISYELYLEGNFELDFNEKYEIYDIDGASKLPDSVIPTEILSYVATNYPQNYITDWELDNGHQQVELNNRLELEFEMDGTFIRIEND